jgi:hypothetical protein
LLDEIHYISPLVPGRKYLDQYTRQRFSAVFANFVHNNGQFGFKFSRGWYSSGFRIYRQFASDPATTAGRIRLVPAAGNRGASRKQENKDWPRPLHVRSSSRYFFDTSTPQGQQGVSSQIRNTLK